MKITRIGPDEIFHRYLTPKWAFLPTSGAGAAIDGGRFNRPGVEALYLSRAPQTALEEYRQGASITPPATLAAYKIRLAEVADLSQGFDPNAWDGAWKEWDCAWRRIARIDRKVPPSWKLADLVIMAGLAGILFPSLRHAGGTNLVIFPANLVEGDGVEVHDPNHRLPRDQSSWP
ncbi:RES domain-containing protein [Allomesorhizobium camelthorni]|uniref:RES domain-containing protein n=1 Tax=Allomesorhizobium camelthorni TaxID=475069 RepID=A0A6G4WJE0_9HYPH|nr:RES domain-containing protein [Mesorhizobium camelthorni]